MATYNTVPTLLGNDKSTAGNYLNDHPVGINAMMGCGGQYNWDCTISASGKILMNGTHSSQFIRTMGSLSHRRLVSNQPVVLCTTCHNQHLMNVVKVTNGVTFTAAAQRVR